MAEIKIIKSYITMTERLKSPAELDYESDRAVTEFRGFSIVAHEHINRVHNSLAMNVIEEIIENLQRELMKRKNRYLQ